MDAKRREIFGVGQNEIYRFSARINMIDSDKMLILAILPLVLFAYIWTIDKTRESGRLAEAVVLGIFGTVLTLIFISLGIGWLTG